MKRYFGFVICGLIALGLSACGSSSTTPASTTATLAMSISQSDSGILTSMVPKNVGGGGIAVKTVDLTTYSISCKDANGTEYTSTITAAGAASVPDVPVGEPVVCYLLDSTGTPITQLTVSDASAIMGGAI